MGFGAGWAEPFDAAVELAAEVRGVVDCTEMVHNIGVPLAHQVGIGGRREGEGEAKLEACFALDALQQAAPPIDVLDSVLMAAVGAGEVDFATGACVDGCSGNGVCLVLGCRHEISGFS